MQQVTFKENRTINKHANHFTNHYDMSNPEDG